MKKNGVFAVLFLMFLFHPIQSNAAGTEERLQRLEDELEKKSKDIAKLEKQVNRAKKTASKANSKLDAFADKLRINGFMTAGVATHNVKGKNYQGITDEVTWQPDAALGLQVVANMTERSSVTVQLVGEATNDRIFSTNMEWAFLSYKATDDLTLRAGRLRTPFYMLSEFYDVGFAYPWVRPPTEVYNIDTLKGFEGFDMLYQWSAGELGGLLQAYIGSGVSSSNPKDFDIIKNWGINNVFTYKDWTFRIGYIGTRVRFYNFDLPADDNGDGTITDIELDHNHNPILSAPVADNLQLQQLSSAGLIVSDASEMPASYTSLGLQYDNGTWFLMSELVRLNWDFDDYTIGIPDQFAGLLGTSEIVFPPAEGYNSGYVTAGYRFGKWTPYLTAARIEHFSDASDSDRLAFDQIISVATGGSMPSEAREMSDSNSYTAGLNYNLTSNIKLKSAVQHFTGAKGSVGNFGNHSGMDGRNVYTFLIDVIY